MRKTRLSAKKSIGRFGRLKKSIKSYPYFYGGVAGLGASLAGSLVFPPAIIGVAPSIVSAGIGQPVVSLSDILVESAKAEKRAFLKMTKKERSDYLARNYGYVIGVKKKSGK
jgi:hypothetical protein